MYTQEMELLKQVEEEALPNCAPLVGGFSRAPRRPCPGLGVQPVRYPEILCWLPYV